MRAGNFNTCLALGNFYGVCALVTVMCRFICLAMYGLQYELGFASEYLRKVNIVS